ncbi:MAG: aminopeptidase P N-terminal domain-containing protein [Candidatus Aminicenantes bacterium]|jgi:Xaa-Pro aminopeptidase
MNRRIILRIFFLLLISLLLLQSYTYAQRTGYTKEEFMRRRAALMEQVQDGIVVFFGNAIPQSGAHFRQDNDFYYFCGREDVNAVLMMIPRMKQSILFLPQTSEREDMFHGINLLKDPEGKKKTGLSSIQPLDSFDEYLARWTGRAGKTLHIRLSPRDTVDNARYEYKLFQARKNRIFYNDQISLDNYRVKKLRERYPFCEFKDITPIVDSMRVIKTPEEIDVLRRNGKISAEGVNQAMLKGKPGVYEYEIEATAMSVILKHGARRFAYPPIVGSGPNSCILHYAENSRMVEDGDIILMDFGGELDYMCMDISRTWPANGKFTEEQKEVYTIALEVQKASIEAYRPGLTAADVRKYVAKKMKQLGINTRGQRGGIGHGVGMATHDVGPMSPLREGMVFAIEPGLYYPDKNLGVRIEDTVLITKDGCEILTKDVPKEIADVEKLLASRKQ